MERKEREHAGFEHRVTEQISQTKCTSAPDSIMVAMTTGPRARQCIYISMSLISDTSEICQYKTKVYFIGEFSVIDDVRCCSLTHSFHQLLKGQSTQKENICQHFFILILFHSGFVSTVEHKRMSKLLFFYIQ